MPEIYLSDGRKSESQEEAVHEKLLFTVLEAASYLSLSRSMIYNLMESGKLRFVKIGSARRIPKACCLELMEKNLMGGWNIPESGDFMGVNL